MDYDELTLKLGQRIRQVRRERGVTQERLAEAVGLHVTHLRRIELGKTNPSLANLWRIADALNTTVPELFDWRSGNRGTPESRPDGLQEATNR